MALGAQLQAVVDAVTAGADADAKTTALVTGLYDVILDHMSFPGPLTPRQQNYHAEQKAEAIDNIADFVTALEVE